MTRDWKAAAALWERRSTALRGVVDLLLECYGRATATSRDPRLALEDALRIQVAFTAMMARPDLAGDAGGEDEFRAKVEDARRRGFDLIRRGYEEGLRSLGRDPAAEPEVVLGDGPVKAPPAPPVRLEDFDAERASSLAALLLDVYAETEDRDPRDVLLRALAVYRSFVRHARGGGQVRFVKEGEKDRTLRVRLR